MLSFIIFKLPESFWNRFRSILLDQKMDFKKNLIEKYLFFVEKNNFFEKKLKIFRKTFTFSKNFSQDFRFFQLKLSFWRKIESFSKIFWTFSENIFSTWKNQYFSMIFFSKFISWSRRIHLKRFQNDSDSLKIRKLKEKSAGREFEVYGSHLGSDNDCMTL